VVARKLGKPFMPWQQHVADVILEIDPTTGLLVYQEFGLTVPRQSGKSTFVLAKSTHRCSATGFFGGRQKLVYTAQTRQKAREKWDEDYAAELEASAAFKNRVRAHRGPGNEHLRFSNGSRFGIEANTEKAGHGSTLDEAYIDEAFAQVDFRLEQAFGPAMITRKNKQLGWISTAGWLDASAYLQQKIALGRAVVDDPTSKIAYFEWSAPDDCDPGDPLVWADCMPALGHTIDESAIRAEYEKAVLAEKLNDFKRAYLNLWVPKESLGESVIRQSVWDSLADRDDVPLPHIGKVALAVDSDPERSRTSIVAAGVRADGMPLVELIENLPGVEWAAHRVMDIVSRNPALVVVIDKRSTAASLIGQLERARMPIVGTDAATMAQATGQFYDAATETGLLRHLDQVELNQALRSAVKRPLSDSWAWDRRTATADITPLTAATLALWGLNTHSRTPKNAGKGRVIALG
jgi:hypothetical protein